MDGFIVSEFPLIFEFYKISKSQSHMVAHTWHEHSHCPCISIEGKGFLVNYLDLFMYICYCRLSTQILMQVCLV